MNPSAKDSIPCGIPSKHGRGFLLRVVLVALAVRLIAVAFGYHELLDPGRDHWAFGWETGRIARSIAMGQGFANPLFQPSGPTAWLTPIYPYLVAAIFKLCGIYSKTSAVAALSLNALFSALTCLPVFFLARRTFDERTAAVAGWFWAVFPPAITFAATWVWDTSLTTLLVTIVLLSTIRLAGVTRLAVWGAFGVLCGVTALTNPAMLAALPLLLAWACFRLRQTGENCGPKAFTAVLALVVTVAPWFLRNHFTFHRFIPFRDTFWLAAHVGNNGDTSHWAPDAAHPSSSAQEEDQFNRLGELNYMGEKKNEVLRFVTGHPSSFAVLVLRRIVFTWTGFWSLSRNYLEKEAGDPLSIFQYVVLLAGTILGIRRAFVERNSFIVPYLILLLCYPVVYYLTIEEWIYRHPIDPEIAILCAYGVLGLSFVRAKKKPVAVAG